MDIVYRSGRLDVNVSLCLHGCSHPDCCNFFFPCDALARECYMRDFFFSKFSRAPSSSSTISPSCTVLSMADRMVCSIFMHEHMPISCNPYAEPYPWVLWRCSSGGGMLIYYVLTPSLLL